MSDQLAVLNINKAYRPDDISPRFVKEGNQPMTPRASPNWTLSTPIRQIYLSLLMGKSKR